MYTTAVTLKGQIVIPSLIRKKYHIKTGTKICVIEHGDEIILRPLTEDYFYRIAGFLNTKGEAAKALLEERREEKEAEDRKWSKS